MGGDEAEMEKVQEIDDPVMGIPPVVPGKRITKGGEKEIKVSGFRIFSAQ